MRASAAFFLTLTLTHLSAFAADEPPAEWIAPATGHRVIRLSREPGSASLYFHQYAYSADGKKLVITTPGGLSTVNLQTRQIDQVVPGRVGVLVTGRKTGHIYHIRDGAVFATDLETHTTREVAKIPADVGRGGSIAVNADETLLVGIASDPEGKAEPRTPPSGGSGEGRLEARWASGTLMVLYTVNIKTREVKRIYREHDWTNHLQCSPTDPNLIMFCHEGPWHYVDRIWTIRADGTGLRLMHKRTMDMEIAGHEFFSADGKTIWYDLQTPKSGVFWLAGVDLVTGNRTQYHVERQDWSVHFNVSPDGKLFAGDGGGPNSVANRSSDGQRLSPPGNGQWIYLFRPVPVRNPASAFPEQKDLIKVGYLKSERLVDLSKHDYRLEPNVTFTPDGKWIVFRSNLHGPTHVYAVEIEKSNTTSLEDQAARLRTLVAQSPKLSLERTALAIQPPSAGWALDMVSSVAVDRSGIIWLLQRGDKADPVIAVNRDGGVLRSWGKGLYKIPHSIRIDPDGNVWTVDAASSVVLKFNAEGKKLLEISVGGQPSNPRSAFCGTTDIAFAPNGRIYISDGYANARVLEYTTDGKRVREWGAPGTGPGQFRQPHGITVDKNNVIYVADRENARIQRFDLDGHYLGEWSSFGKTVSLTVKDGALWLGTQQRNEPNTAPGWLMKIDPSTGKLLGSVESPGHHSIDVTAGGELFTGTRPDQVLWFRR